jgi:hypothetical protein
MAQTVETHTLKNTELVYYADEFGHSYEIDGEVVAGVTTLLSLGVPADAGLLEYYKRNSIEDQEAILMDAQERGTNVHQAIELLLNGGKVESQNFKRKHEKKGITAFVDWFNKVKPEKALAERVVAFVGGKDKDGKPMRFAGTVDLICTINGRRVLIDFKTSKTHSKKNSLQVQAYRKAVEASYDETIDDCYILYLGTSHKGTRAKEIDGMPSTGLGWSLIKSEDTFADFKRAYNMALWAVGGYPKPPKVEVYPTEWGLQLVDGADADIEELTKKLQETQGE